MAAVLLNIALFLCYASSFQCLIRAAAISGNETDRLALLAFKASITNDPFGSLNSWNESNHFCQWGGVACSRKRPRVTVLDLSHKGLGGFISPYIGNLSFLRTLRLQNNSFNHVMPPELGRLRRLQDLFLHNNSIGGGIPRNISSCSSLTRFIVSRNQIVGKIPAEVGSLINLEVISMDNNHLSGTIPPSVGNLSSLVELNVGDNNLVGAIPVGFSRLSELQYSLFSVNNLSGTIPPEMFNLSSLKSFSVTNNNLRGNLPLGFGNSLPNLGFFSIGGNQISGSIPTSVSNASNLAYVILTENKLTGQVPNLGNLHKLRRLVITTNRLGSGQANDLSFISSLTNATNLEILAVNQNNFGGNLPQSLGNLSTNLAILFLDNNQISGGIPEGISKLINLENLQLWRNRLTGEIPHDIGRLQKMKSLILNQNQLSGSIPSSIGNLNSLLELRLPRNKLQGSIPSSLGSFPRLQIFDISENNLTGTIPQNFFDFPSLSIFLDISNNQLVGSIPIGIGNLENVGMIDISNNMFSGEIPSALGNCKSLQNLFMGRNNFSGTIPSSLSSLKGLRRIDIALNNLSGEIPRFLGSLNLSFLNISFNDFEGAIPDEGIFKNASAISIFGNPKLCGGAPQLQLPRCPSEPSEKFTSTLAFKLIVSIISGLLVISLFLVLLLLYWFKKPKKKASSDSSMTLVSNISFQSIVRATDRFSSANLIGIGAYGSVYKGILADGTIVAIKVFNLEHHGAAKSFLAECEALRSIKHRNLVKVLSACSGIDNQGNDFKALIYEFMVNGSLDDWLHPKREESLAGEESSKLSLYQRLNIAIDVAHALEYLHNQCQTSIVHCDLKPSNVLLDHELVAHVGDFGLARILSEENVSVGASSSIFRGSIGFAPPEYGRQGEVTTDGDVYSFGILVLEMLTGKRPTDNMFIDGLNLHTFVEAALPDQVATITDPEILEEIQNRTNIYSNTSQDSVEVEHILISVFQVGVRCSNDSARERMNISDAVSELQSSKGKFSRNLLD